MWQQQTVCLAPQPRGFHLITHEIVQQLPELKNIQVGLMHVFMQHTSASLTINENADPAVRQDFAAFFSDIVAEDKSYYTHVDEGPDDMPAHLKGALLGFDLTIPITQGRLNLGTWQGIYLCEHRNHGGARNLLITIQGE